MPAVNIHTVFLKMANAFSQLSHAKRNKVGALIVKNGRIISTGYNGMPSGFDPECEDIWDIANQSGMTTKPEVIHAEANAILFAARHGQATNDCSIYLTLSPCVNCAKLIIQAGIKAVYYSEQYRDKAGLELLHKAEINTYLHAE